MNLVAIHHSTRMVRALAGGLCGAGTALPLFDGARAQSVVAGVGARGDPAP